MDRISSLPDEVLGHMLSFLPTKQAASTSLLSKRWRNVFVLVSSLEHYYVSSDSPRYCLPENLRNYIEFVENLLNLQGNAALKKLTLKSPLDSHAADVGLTRVQRWIRNALERGVADLDMFLTFNKEHSDPVSLLIFNSKTLVNLRLGRGFKIKLSDDDDVSLPKLKTLFLESIYCDVDHQVLETLLPHCPVLEELVVVEHRWKQSCGSVSSPSLKRLCIRFFNVPTITLDVPNLVYLELSCIFGSKYAVVNLDHLVEAKLNLWVEEYQLSQLRRGSSPLVPADIFDLIVAIRNVRVLHLTSDALELFYFSGQELPMFNNLVWLSISSDKKQGWQVLPLLIKNSPNLKTLIFKGLEHLVTENCGDACVCTGSKKKSSCCLSSSQVKVMEIWGYQGTSRDCLQVKHFLKMLPCLELLKFRAANKLLIPVDIHYFSSLPKASSVCKIQAIF